MARNKEGRGSANPLLEWYRQLQPRFLDLVGDYTGDETFILEGDSLLLQAFSDSHLDFHHGGLQLLHAVYVVERLLADLKRRHCNFIIIFFDCHSQLCIPHNVRPDEGFAQKYLMAREVVFNHLQSNTAEKNEAMIRRFPSYQDDAFQRFLDDCGAYFIMCHDGSNPNAGVEAVAVSKVAAVSKDGSEDDSEEDSEEDSEDDSEDDSDDDSNHEETHIDHATGFQSLIFWSMSQKYNVVLLNGIEFHDSRVMATALEMLTTETPPADLELSMKALDETLPDPKILSWSRSISISALHKNQLTQRELLTLLTLSLMDHEGCIDQNDAQDAKYIEAVLIQCVLLGKIPLSHRAVDLPDKLTDSQIRAQALLTETCRAATQILRSELWGSYVSSLQLGECDIADFMDGRLLVSVVSQLPLELGGKSLAQFYALCNALEAVTGGSINVASDARDDESDSDSTSTGSSSDGSSETGNPSQDRIRRADSGLLPFSHPVFDSYLESVHINAPNRKTNNPSASAARVFAELSHWQNQRRSLDPQKIQPAPTVKQQKAHQRQMAEMRDYAASLTNCSGSILKPETIIEGSTQNQPAKTWEKKTNNGPAGQGKPQKKVGASKKGGKAAAIDAASAVLQKKQDKVVDAALGGWVSLNGATRRGATARIKEPTVDEALSAYARAENYIAKLPEDKRAIVLPDALCYLVEVLYFLWKHGPGQSSTTPGTRPLHIAARCWHTIDKIRQLETGISDDISRCVQHVTRVLDLPPAKLRAVDVNRLLSVHFPGIDPKDLSRPDLRIGLSRHEFQLAHAGPYLDRSVGSAPDPRVQSFEPDEWQRRVLDQIDRKKSLLVVAPTSAGKTFISFYAMRQVLSSDSDGVLVYVAPTKALVNQIAAEVQARFSKQFKYGGKSVWAVHTREYRINNATGCQVLVTVPHILQIMLMAPSNAKSWSKRVRYIIFDEVHCIGQADDGLVWEQLLLMAPCPIIALSATIGNPQAFSDWLTVTRNGRIEASSSRKRGTSKEEDELVMIQHPHRYSDLRKFVYQPPEKFSFHGLRPASQSLKLGLDDHPSFEFMHPYASLSNPARGIPPDLALEPRDCWTLWQSMKRHQTPEYPVDSSLDPDSFIPEEVRKLDVFSWQAKLDRVLKSWMQDPHSPFHAVLADLERNVISSKRPELQVSEGRQKISANSQKDAAAINSNSLEETVLPLICSLQEQNALPALFFNYDQYGCEEIGKAVLSQLEQAEDNFKSSSAEWSKKLSQWSEWKDRMEETARREKKAPKKPTKAKLDKDEMVPDDGANDNTEEASSWATFDPEDPIDGFHLAGITMAASRVDFAEYRAKLEWRGVAKWLINALRRGIGVHHEGMNRKYRQLCEILFRSGYLRVVIATGSLALGVNMPCKTVVFAGDSTYLTALNFRQAAGRAGRRGFDLLGNVVFQNVPYPRVTRLLTSHLPELRGHFPLTTSLILRMFTLLHGSESSEYSRRAVSSLLSVPRIYIDDPDESKSKVLHHLRFSIEYLRRNHLLSASGKPLNFTSIVSHLYYEENSAFGFHALLKEGYFHRVCADIMASSGSRRVAGLRALMLVMAHLFGRRKIPTAYLEEWIETRKKMTGTLASSVVILPALPDEAKNLLRSHNSETRDIFAAYVRTFAEQHLEGKPDDRLPFSDKRFGGTYSHSDPTVANARAPTNTTSWFVALSGHGDDSSTIRDLCKTVRSGVWLEDVVVPYVPVESKDPLNAYLYDFYSHGDIMALQDWNRIRKSEVWYLLNDFSMVLATIVTGFNNMLSLSTEGDLDADMINVQACGDAIDDDVVDEYEGNDGIPDASTQAKAKSSAKMKKVVVIEDEEDEDVPDTWDAGTDDDSGEDNDHAGDGPDLGSGNAGDTTGGIMNVLKAFRLLQAEFDTKFRVTWA